MFAPETRDKLYNFRDQQPCEHVDWECITSDKVDALKSEQCGEIIRGDIFSASYQYNKTGKKHVTTMQNLTIF